MMSTAETVEGGAAEVEKESAPSKQETDHPKERGGELLTHDDRWIRYFI
jgi:hypothetical protein